MATTITTSTATTATAYSNQRKIDRTSNGVLWSCFQPDGGWKFYYSLDNGTTWTHDTAANIDGGTTSTNGSFFIDVDDYAHFVYKNMNDGYIYYRRGTPNAGRTAWTWSAALTVESSNPSMINMPDVVAHREGTGWVAHIATSFTNNASQITCNVHKVAISSGGTFTLTQWVVTYSVSLGTAQHSCPSIDFHHTGDGKTVKGGTPHVYVGWTFTWQGGANYGVNFARGTYSGGTWTWGSMRDIDNTRYQSSAVGGTWFIGAFDGTRFVMMGCLADSNSSNRDLVIYERDAADTTTTTRVLLDNASTTDQLLSGSGAFDDSGNVYIFGRDATGASGTRKLNYRKWTRSTLTLGSINTLESSAPDEPFISARRGYSSQRIEFVYRDGTATPYNVAYDLVSLNLPPTVTLNSVGTFDPRLSKTISWTFSDPDAGHTQTAYELDYRISGGTWASLSTGTTASSYNVPANTFADETNYEIRVRVKDASLWSAYDSKTFYTDSWTYYPEGTVFTSTPAYADIVKADEPVGYWRLGEASGTVAVDSSGNGLNGEHRNSPVLGLTGAISGDSDKAIKYNNGQTTPHNTRVPQRIGASGSISMWVDTTSWGADGLPHGVFQSGDHSTTNYAGWLALFRWQGADSTNSPFYFRIVNDAGTLKDLAMNWQTYFGATLGWHQITATWGNGSMALYVDGTQVASRSDVGTYSGDQSVNNSSYSLIGFGHQWSGNGTSIDEVAMFNRALTAAEIKRHYDAGNGIAINSKTTISTATLDTNSDYEVQVRVKDGYHYSAWSPSADLVFTRHYVYDGGVWKPNLKRQYWINSWRGGTSTNF